MTSPSVIYLILCHRCLIGLFSLQPNKDFLRKIPKGSEVANILVGEVETLRQKIVVFARLDEAKVLGDITEVNLPTKFMFVILGPKGFQSKYTEMGRAMATMAVDEVCHCIVQLGIL